MRLHNKVVQQTITNNIGETKMKKILALSLLLGSLISTTSNAATPIQLMQCQMAINGALVEHVGNASGIAPQDGDQNSLARYAKYSNSAQQIIGNDQNLSKKLNEVCIKLFDAAESVK
jgi:hypothetical protein